MSESGPRGRWTGKELPETRVDVVGKPEYPPYPVYLMEKVALPDGRFVMASVALFVTRADAERYASLRAFAQREHERHVLPIRSCPLCIEAAHPRSSSARETAEGRHEDEWGHP